MSKQHSYIKVTEGARASIAFNEAYSIMSCTAEMQLFQYS